ncbi:MAG: universal stress protein [Nitrospiraceae bacterium]|nr:universal stress protein [Nitrospiraceae bacterium]
MYRRILAAVNEHLNSEVSARYALELAKGTGSALYLCHVAEKGVSQRDFKYAENALKRLFHKAEDMGISVKAEIDTGDPAEKICEIVDSEGIDIVFASTRREDVERRYYAGTTARRLSIRLPCSVALVRVVHMGRVHPRKVLVPLKAHVNHIVERSYFIGQLAKVFDSGVYLFHITKPVIRFFHGEVHLRRAELEKKLPKDIEHFIKELDKYKVRPEKGLVPGKAGKSITIEATAKRFDLIIMGASERSLMSSLIQGNPVEDVLRETPCDLIILKPRHEDK